MVSKNYVKLNKTILLTGLTDNHKIVKFYLIIN